MLGLGGALTTGSTTEQMYSLLLDGTGDYLDTGNAYQSTIRGSFSWSFWIKPDDGQPGAAENLLGSDNSDDTDAFYITLTAGRIRIAHEANDDDAAYVTNAAVYADGAGDWKHICVTITTASDTNTSYIIYIDGAAVAGSLTDAVEEAKHAAWTSADTVYIGATNDNGTALNPFTGKMDEVALWNVALDANAVAAVYNSGKPFGLTTDRGNYDNASDLTGYWRMFNGSFDHKKEGIVHDQTNPGFGGEIIANADFSANEASDHDQLIDGLQFDDWVEQPNSSQGGSTTYTLTDGVLKQTVVDPPDSVYMQRLQQIVESSLTEGKTYRFQVAVRSSSVGQFWAGIFQLNLANRQTTAPTLVANQWFYIDEYFVYDEDSSGATAANQYAVFYHKTIPSAGDYFEIANLSLTELSGSPGFAAANAQFSTDTPDD